MALSFWELETQILSFPIASLFRAAPMGEVGGDIPAAQGPTCPCWGHPTYPVWGWAQLGAPGGFSGQYVPCLGRSPQIASMDLRVWCLQSAEALFWYPNPFWTYVCSITLLKCSENQTHYLLFSNDIRCYSHVFSPFKFRRCLQNWICCWQFLLLGPKLKISAALRSCWLCPYEQLPFKFPRWRRLVACFAALSGNEYELKGLYLRAVSLFCLRGFFFSYITKFPRKIDISGKGQRQTGDYRSHWISATFHCKGQLSAVGFQLTVPRLVSISGEILHVFR